MKTKAKTGRKYLKNHTSDKDLISRKYKELKTNKNEMVFNKHSTKDNIQRINKHIKACST